MKQYAVVVLSLLCLAGCDAKHNAFQRSWEESERNWKRLMKEQEERQQEERGGMSRDEWERLRAEQEKRQQGERAKEEQEREQSKAEFHRKAAEFLQKERRGNITNLTVFEVKSLVVRWRTLQTTLVKLYREQAPDRSTIFVTVPPNNEQADLFAISTYYSVFGKPERVVTGWDTLVFGDFFDKCEDPYLFCYPCQDATVILRVLVSPIGANPVLINIGELSAL